MVGSGLEAAKHWRWSNDVIRPGTHVQVQGRAAERRRVPCNIGLALPLDHARPRSDIRDKQRIVEAVVPIT